MKSGAVNKVKTTTGHRIVSSFTRAIPEFKRVCMRFLANRKVEGDARTRLE
jgi:hypothetical protein